MNPQQPVSIVAHIATTPVWRWLVIPGGNPYIYIPAPNAFQAKSIADSLDRRTSRPESYIHFPVTGGIRTALGLPRPLMPDVTRLPGHRAWEPVSAETWTEELARGACATAVLTMHQPGQDQQTLHLIAQPAK